MKFTGHERDLANPGGTGDDLDYMHARFCSPLTGRFLSPDPLADSAHPSRPQSFNRFSYVESNPLKFVDPSGEIISLAGLSNKQQTKLLAQLAEFTGNTYGVDQNGNLELISVGGDNSWAATNYLSGLIGDTNRVFNVVSTTGRNQFNRNTGNIEINTESFDEANYGKVDPRTFNLGSTLVHELHHADTNLIDTSTGTSSGVLRLAPDWISPTVRFVNSMRAERGLPQRAAYIGEPVGFFNKKERIHFDHVNPRRPGKIHYVVRKRF